MKKKIISIMVLGILLLGATGSVVLATVGAPCTGPEECDSGESCVSGICELSSGGTAPQTLKEHCTLDSEMKWKSGKVNGQECSSLFPCTLEKWKFVGPLNSGVDKQTDQWGMICLINTVNNVTNWIFYLLMVAVVVLVVIGGAMYMMSGGNPETAGKGKKIITYGIIGLVIALLARLIPSVVKLIVGMG